MGRTTKKRASAAGAEQRLIALGIEPPAPPEPFGSSVEMATGGWKDTTTLLTCNQYTDEQSMLRVMAVPKKLVALE